MRTKIVTLLAFLLCLCSTLIACGKDSVPAVSTTTSSLPAITVSDSPSPTPIIATDYSKSESWLALPTALDKPVDVFFVYPSAWQKAKPEDPNICEIDNPMMLNGSKLALNRVATAFETVGNIYAPYYRQADARSVLSLPLIE